MKQFKYLLLISIAWFSINIYAATPTASQIELFKQLPPSQQKALAKQYGVDLPGNSVEKEPKIEAYSIKEREIEETSTKKIDEYFDIEDKKLKPFGYELFQGNPTTFMPSELAPIPDDYLLGPGDQLNISFYGKEASDYAIEINRDGQLLIPNLAPITVVGMKFSEAKSFLNDRIASQKIGTKVYVSMGQMRSIRVMVLGEAFKPGTYQVSALSTITHALIVSGGVSDIASLRNIELKRNGTKLHSLDLYNFLLEGNNAGDIRLKDGDVIFIPPVGEQVTVKGEVKRPGIFELKPDDTIQEAIMFAGGGTTKALLERVELHTKSDNNLKVIKTIDFSTGSQSYSLNNGDVISISENGSGLFGKVTVIGAVNNPGLAEWVEGAKVDSYIRTIQGDLKSYADLDYSLIVRESTENIGHIEILQFSLKKALLEGGRDNLIIKENDTLIIFSKYNLASSEKQIYSDLVFSNEQIEENIKRKQVENFKQKEFKKFIGAANSNESEKSIEQNLILESDIQQSLFGRQRLLEPLLNKLRGQASDLNGSKIAFIRGGVKFSGFYPISQNKSLEDLIVAAGGLSNKASKDIEITRKKIIDGIYQQNHFSATLRESIELKSDDVVNLYEISNWKESRSVELVGELKHPGVYSIADGESLLNVIERAGGFTSEAFVDGAIFTRSSVKEMEAAQLKMLSENLQKEFATKIIQSDGLSNTPDYSEVKELISDITDSTPLGRIVIDLSGIVSGENNLELNDEDKLFVPMFQNVVNVIGEVQNSSTHFYKEELTLDDYLNLSGGFKSRADTKGIYVVQANGGIVTLPSDSWFSVERELLIKPGDTIVVPIDSDYTSNLALWTSATQILYQLGIAVAAISSL